MHLRHTLALALLASACQSIEAEMGPHERFGLESHASAWSEEDAERVSREMEQLVPRVRALKKVPKPAPLVILTREPLPGYLVGIQDARLILLGPEPHSHQRLSLAHELSHWFRDPVWFRLPYLVEEGLATHVAGLVLPREASRQYQHFYFQTPDVMDLDSFSEACRQELEDFSKRSQEEELRLRAIGFVVASELGIAGLRDLCERAEREGLAQIPADWIYEALPLHHVASGSWKAANNRRMNELCAEAARGQAESD